MPGESSPSRRCWPSRWLILWATYHEVVRTIAARFNAVCTRTHARRPHPIACALTLGRLLSLPLSPSLSLSAARSQCIGTSGGKGQGGSALSSRDEKKAYLKRATCVDGRRSATGSSTFASARPQPSPALSVMATSSSATTSVDTSVAASRARVSYAQVSSVM